MFSFFRSPTAPRGGWPEPPDEARASYTGPVSLRDPVLNSWFLPATSSTGFAVSEETALRLSAVFACTKILSESFAVPSLKLYRRRKSGGKDEARDHPLFFLWHDAVNDDLTSFRARELLQKYLCLRGNGYAQIVRRGNGQVERIDPITTPVRTYRVESGRPAYEFTQNGSKTVLLGREGEILHLRGYPADDGLTGLSPIGYMREALGLGLAAEQYGARFFAGGGVNPFYVKHPGDLGDTARKNLEDSLMKFYGGLGNAHKFMLLDEGMEAQTLGLPLKDLQFIELRKFQMEEVARCYRVPLHLLQNLDRATNNNIEHQSLEFVMYTMQPWFDRWEDDLNLQMLTRSEREQYFFKFSVDDLLRGDAMSQAQSLAIERQNGIINANEWREAKGRNPREDEAGKTYWEPLNMGTGGAANPAAVQNKEPKSGTA